MPEYRLALLGDPVAHSRSPAIHRVMLELSGLRGDYTTIQADEDILAATVGELRAGTWDGLNVTMPLKGAAARLADALSLQARRSGSVNTLLVSGSEVYGDSTDSTAFRELMARPEFDECPAVLILGAGGSASAVLAAIDSPGHVYVAARRLEQAQALTERLGGQAIAWGAAVSGALIVNTTPIGMKGESLPEGVLEMAGGLIDLPYGPGATPAISAAHLLGVPSVAGEEFLIRQAMASFAMWTGHQVDYEALTSSLGKRL